MAPANVRPQASTPAGKIVRPRTETAQFRALAARQRAALERAADAVELAIDAPTWPQCVDRLLDLADELRAHLAARPRRRPR